MNFIKKCQFSLSVFSLNKRVKTVYEWFILKTLKMRQFQVNQASDSKLQRSKTLFNFNQKRINKN